MPVVGTSTRGRKSTLEGKELVAAASAAGTNVRWLIGQLGGNLPTPGGIGGVDFGLVGTFTLYHHPLAVSAAAVLTYHAISLWVPGLLGSLAFVQLRRTLQREAQPAVICTPLAEPIPTTP